MAEKPKKQSNLRVVLKRALSLVLLGFFAFSPMLVSAAGCKQESSYQQCDIDSIMVNMDTYTGGSSPDNYARVGADGTLRMTAKVTLATPSYFTVGTDKVNTNTWGSNTVSSFAIGLIAKDKVKTDCQLDKTVSIGAGTTFINCKFFDSKNGQTSGRVDSGGVLVNNGFSISGSQFAQLGMTAPATGYTRYSLYIYPYMNYGAIQDTQIAFDKAGKEMVIDLYAKQTDATAANASGRPSDVPGYGSTSGGASNGEAGGPLWGIINKIVGFLLGIIQEIIYAIFYFLIVPIIQAMLSIRVYTDTFVSVIYPGWIVLRNLCNIIFIVAIMAIAMGTLLRVDAYKSRSVLVQLILAALLVNFSLVIAQIVLGVADTVQNQFLPNNQEVIRALGKDLMVAYRSEVYNLKLGGYFSDIVKQFMFLILATGSFMVFLAIAAFLFIRMIMLWILLMLSPLAYAAGALPSTAHYRKEWWTTFLKYAFFTPIMAFFLNMTAIISNTYKKNPIFGDLGVKDSDFGDSSLAGFVFRVGSTLLLIVFLLVALKVAESFSIYGASEVSKFAKKGMFAPAGVAAAAGKLGGRAYAKFTAEKAYQAKLEGKTGKQFLWNAAQLAHPTVAKKAWEAYSHEKEMDAFDPGKGDVRDFFNRYIPTNYHWGFDKHARGWKKLVPVQALGQKTDYGKVERTNVTAHKRSELDKAPMSEEQKNKFGLGLHHAGDIVAFEYIIQDGRHEDGYRIQALAEERDKVAQEIYARLKQQHPDWSEEVLVNTSKEEAKKEVLPVYSAVDYVDMIEERLHHSGLTKDEIATELVYLTEQGETNSKERSFGYALNEWDGQDRAVNDFTGYKLYEQKFGKAALMKKIAEETNGQGVEVFEQRGDSLVFKPRLFDGDTAAVAGQEWVVNDFESFNNAMDESHQLNWKDRRPVNAAGDYDAKAKLRFHGNGITDLRDIMMGARKALDAGKRLKRGNSEDKFAMMEPAVENLQYEGGYYGTNAYSMFKAHYIPRNLAYKMPNMRRFQGRNMYILGLKENNEGRVIIDGPEQTIDYQTMVVKLASAPTTNSALLQGMGFSDGELRKIRDQLNQPDIKRNAQGRDPRIQEFRISKSGPGNKPWILPIYQGEAIDPSDTLV